MTGLLPPLYRKCRGESETAWSGIMYIELPLIIVLQRQREMRRCWRRLPARTFRRNYFDEGRRFLNLN